jgi:hypothetical protein
MNHKCSFAGLDDHRYAFEMILADLLIPLADFLSRDAGGRSLQPPLFRPWRTAFTWAAVLLYARRSLPSNGDVLASFFLTQAKLFSYQP